MNEVSGNAVARSSPTMPPQIVGREWLKAFTPESRTTGRSLTVQSPCAILKLWTKTFLIEST
jgi:hypothetical protein